MDDIRSFSDCLPGRLLWPVVELLEVCSVFSALVETHQLGQANSKAVGELREVVERRADLSAFDHADEVAREIGTVGNGLL